MTVLHVSAALAAAGLVLFVLAGWEFVSRWRERK